jgi:hypothetical protein
LFKTDEGFVWNDDLSKIEKLDVAYKRKDAEAAAAAHATTRIETGRESRMTSERVWLYPPRRLGELLWVVVAALQC